VAPFQLPLLRSRSHVTTDGQSSSLSWCQAPIWGFRPDFYYRETVAGLLMWGSLPDERTGLPFTIQAGPSPRGLVTIFYCLRFENSPTWRARSLYLCPSGTGWPGYTPRHWVTLSPASSYFSCSPYNPFARTVYNTHIRCRGNVSIEPLPRNGSALYNVKLVPEQMRKDADLLKLLGYIQDIQEDNIKMCS
jgi:hypothetical protein